MDEVFMAPCRPTATRQMVECITPDGEGAHGVHRKLTELVHFMCNCGVSTGWVPVDEAPVTTDFLEEHAPSEEARESLRRARELG